MSLWPEKDLQDALKIVQINLDKNRYIPLSPEYSLLVRQHYRDQLTIPEGEQVVNICSPTGLLLAHGYQRIVIGDYGAYLEITPEQMVVNHIRIKPGQKYRLNQDYKVKYHWFEPTDGSQVKIYYQQRKVNYADYLPGMYYISPTEIGE